MDETVRPMKNNKALNKKSSHLNVPNVTRSLPSSPAIHASSPSLGSSSSPRNQAQRFALLHFLAIGPSPEAVIVKKTAIPRLECIQLLGKVAKQSEPGVWQLGERWFKELDVWQFPYPSQQQRQNAIDNAIRAFDRQRLSREDKVWQVLLPKEERGKGKILSKLYLTGGLTPQPATSLTGSIGAVSDTSEQPKTLLVPGSEGMARSTSHDPTKPKKASEKEAMSKRLFGNKKTAPPVRAPKSAVKTLETGDKKVASSANAVTPVKAGVKRKAEPKVKSAEFVERSDDDAGEITAPAVKRIKTASGAVKVAPQAASKSTQDIHKPALVQGDTTRKLVTGKPASALAATATPKVQPAVVKSSTTADKSKVTNDRTKGANASPSIAKPAVKPVANLEAGEKVTVAKSVTPGVTTQKKSVAAATQTAKQTQAAPKQPPAPASASSASSSTWFSSLTSASHRHTSSQSSISSSGSGINKPVIQKRMVPVKTITPTASGSLTKKSKMDSSPAKPSSLRSSNNISDSDPPSSDRSRALSGVDSPAFTANTPGQDIDMVDSPTPMSRVPSSEGSASVSHTLSHRSSEESLPSKLEPAVELPPDISISALNEKKEKALDVYLQARIEADRAYPDGLPNEVKLELWGQHHTYQYLKKEVEVRGDGIDNGEPDLATLSRIVPAGSAAYFRNKLHEEWPKYTALYDECAALTEAPQDKLRELHILTGTCQDLQKLHAAAQKRDEDTQREMYSSPKVDAPELPLSRRQTLVMYVGFQRNLAAYTSFQHEIRTLPSYPDLSREMLDKDAQMFNRLVEMRRDIFGGFDEMVRKAAVPPMGMVRWDDAENEGGLYTEIEAEVGTWRVRNRFTKWSQDYVSVRNEFGELNLEGMTALWDELDAIKVVERKLLVAVALKFGENEEADLGEVSLEAFEPLDGRKGCK